MNSQFKNSSFGSIIYIGIIAIIAIGLILISWYMFAGYKLGTYSEDTLIGSVYLGGLTEDDIGARVFNRENDWKSDDSIVFELTYQDNHYEFDRDLFYFNLPLSMTKFEDGKTNDLIAQYQESGTDRIDVSQEIYNLPFLDHVKDNIDIDGMINAILADASLMKTYSSVEVEDYLLFPTASYQNIAIVEFDVPDNADLDKMILEVNNIYGDAYIDLNSKELFDVIKVFGELYNDTEMSILSSAIMELALETNFSIHEVHYRPVIDLENYTVETFPLYGHNTLINTVSGDNFSIYNPNDSGYLLKIEKAGDKGQLTLVGLPFVNTISVEIHLTQIEYISQVTNDAELVQEGNNGMIVVVQRVITDVNEIVIYDKDIVFEFYPPEAEITLQP